MRLVLEFANKRIAISAFSSEGIQWVLQRSGEQSFDQINSTLALNKALLGNVPKSLQDTFHVRIHIGMPPKEEAVVMFRDYFAAFNQFCQLFCQEEFMATVEQEYSKAETYHRRGVWASMNIVLSIEYTRRARGISDCEDSRRSLLHLKNAMAVFPELSFTTADLWSVQALLGMVCLLSLFSIYTHLA